MPKNRQRLRLTRPKATAIRSPSPLRLTPYVWRKLLFLGDQGPTEVGGFGISSRDDLLLLEDIALVPQRCTPAAVKIDDRGVADHGDRHVALGDEQPQFGKVWMHILSGDSAIPGSTEEATFVRCCGQSDWAVMFLLAQGGETYARLSLRLGPGAELCLPVEIDFSRPFPGSQEELWEQEYLRSVEEECCFRPRDEELLEAVRNPPRAGLRPRETCLADPFCDSDRLKVIGDTSPAAWFL